LRSAGLPARRSKVPRQSKWQDRGIIPESAEPWRVTLVDTGEKTHTGGRLKRVSSYLGEEDFCFTYGDGVGNIDISGLIAFHKQERTLATVTAVAPPGRFGALSVDKTRITGFQEKPGGDGSRISGGFFVLNPKVLDYIEGDHTIWERGPMEQLAREGNVSAYLHEGFWQCMDTLRDRMLLEELWESGRAPWKIWD
jgi:glucose-1-phosphate cytidylyltransferase